MNVLDETNIWPSLFVSCTFFYIWLIIIVRYLFIYLFFFLDTTMGTKEPKSRTVEEIKGCPSSIQVAEVEVEIP